METRRARSGPVFVQTARGTISLVFEATVRGGAGEGRGGESLQVIGKPDVYVIDGDGVRLVRHRNTIARSVGALFAGVAVYLLVWFISRLLEGKEQ